MKNDSTTENGTHKTRKMSHLLLLKLDDFYANERAYVAANIPCARALKLINIIQLSSVGINTMNFFYF